MTNTDVRSLSAAESVLLPLESLALVGSSEQGTAAIRNYGIGAGDFEAEFRKLEARLEGAQDIEAPAQLAVCRLVSDIARRAQAWMSVISDDSAVASAIVLVGPEPLLAAVLHGPLVEYATGGRDLLLRVVLGVIGVNPAAEVRLTVWDGDSALASARFADGQVDLASKDARQLVRMSSRASEGTGALLESLLEEFAR